MFSRSFALALGLYLLNFNNIALRHLGIRHIYSTNASWLICTPVQMYKSKSWEEGGRRCFRFHLIVLPWATRPPQDVVLSSGSAKLTKYVGGYFLETHNSEITQFSVGCIKDVVKTLVYSNLSICFLSAHPWCCFFPFSVSIYRVFIWVFFLHKFCLVMLFVFVPIWKGRRFDYCLKNI